jgi:hypothetical protein
VMCSTDAAIPIIEKYILDNLFAPEIDWDDYEFKKRAYQRWAAYEICNRIMDRYTDDPIDVIENFIFEWSAYTGNNRVYEFIFNTAIEVANEILLLLV